MSEIDPTWDADAAWDALIDAQLANAPEPEPNYPDAPFSCVGGCGYPVPERDMLCGECACEEDADVY